MRNFLIISLAENNDTGRGNRNILLAKKLVKQGHKVTFLTSNFDHGKKIRIHPTKFIESKNFYFDTFSIPKYKTNLSLLRFAGHYIFSFKLLYKYKNQNFDLVFASSIPPEILFISTFLKRKKLVVDIRDIWPDAIFSYRDKSILKNIFKIYCDYIYKLSLKKVDLFTLVAPSYNNWLKKYLKKFKWKFIPLGFEEKDFKDFDINNMYKYEYCYAGGLTPQFDFTDFESELKDARILFIGGGPSKKRLKKIYKNSIFKGVVSRKEAMNLMKQSKYLIFPTNRYAKLPNKAFDYFALGKRVKFSHNISREAKFLFSLREKSSQQNEIKKFQALEKKYIIEKLSKVVTDAII